MSSLTVYDSGVVGKGITIGIFGSRLLVYGGCEGHSFGSTDMKSGL